MSIKCNNFFSFSKYLPSSSSSSFTARNPPSSPISISISIRKFCRLRLYEFLALLLFFHSPTRHILWQILKLSFYANDLNGINVNYTSKFMHENLIFTCSDTHKQTCKRAHLHKSYTKYGALQTLLPQVQSENMLFQGDQNVCSAATLSVATDYFRMKNRQTDKHVHNISQ